MNKFTNLIEAINWIQSQTKFQNKKDLNQFREAYNKLNIDLSNIKKIHVGGTNGKGSVSAFLTNVLVNNNITVGTFTSSYLVNFNERIKVNNLDISDDDLLNIINFMYDFNEDLFKTINYKLSFFEILTLMAFKHYSDLKLDVIIIEVGIGGRLDVTNILEYDLLIITSIGFDHLKVLGNTLEQIAGEKLGALKGDTHLIANPPKELREQFISSAKTYTFVDELKPFNLKLLGTFQQSNANLAYLAMKHLYNFDDSKVVPHLESTLWPGRLEQVKPKLYLDGAHNISAMIALRESLLTIFKGQKVNIVFSALKDKDITGMLEILKHQDFKIHLTSFPDFRFESLASFETEKIKYYEDPFALINSLKDDVTIVCGSLHFIGYLKANINKLNWLKQKNDNLNL